MFGALLEYTVILLKLKLKKVSLETKKRRDKINLRRSRTEERTLYGCLMFCNLEANVPLSSFSVKTKVKTESGGQMNGFSSHGSGTSTRGLSRPGAAHKADR